MVNAQKKWLTSTCYNLAPYQTCKDNLSSKSGRGRHDGAGVNFVPQVVRFSIVSLAVAGLVAPVPAGGLTRGNGGRISFADIGSALPDNGGDLPCYFWAPKGENA
jgi:hypothetical protein